MCWRRIEKVNLTELVTDGEVLESSKSKGKGKVVLLQARCGPEVG